MIGRSVEVRLAPTIFGVLVLIVKNKPVVSDLLNSVSRQSVAREFSALGREFGLCLLWYANETLLSIPTAILPVFENQDNRLADDFGTHNRIRTDALTDLSHAFLPFADQGVCKTIQHRAACPESNPEKQMRVRRC